MKRLYIIFLLLFFLQLNTHGQLEFSETNLQTKLIEQNNLKTFHRTLNSSILDSIITNYITIENIPGATGLIINKHGDVLWSGNYGYRNLGQQLIVEDSTLYFMGSISKTFVATAIMQLWESGLIDLDGNINDYLPPALTVTNPSYPNDTITVKMLMTHSSSLRDNWNSMWQLWGCGDYPVSVDSFLVNYFTPGGTYYNLGNFYGYHPGWTYNYSNAGSCLLALMVKHLTGKNFDVFTRDSILTPLEMNSTSWFLSGTDTNNIAIPYAYNPPQPYCHMGIAYWPIGQLRTNKFELANFVSAYLNNGTYNNYRILDSSTISLIFSDHLGDPLPWGGEQGLLWYTDPGLASTPWGHEGGWIGCQTAMYLSQEENWGVLFFINWANPGNYSPGFYPTLYQIVNYANLVTDAAENFSIVKTFSLNQNYPNPFNPITTFRYAIPQTSKVVIKVYDILGNEIATLMDEEKTVGTYELMWNATSLPSGVYFYQLKAVDPSTGSGQVFVSTKKMILLK